jgi:amino acid adenylation domain-containing protein
MQEGMNAGFQLSPQQARLWQLGENTPAFRAQIAIRLEGTLEVARLQRAVERTVARHEILRTRFRRQAGLRLPFQVVTGSVEFDWTESDWSSEDLPRVLAGERARALDFERGPLLRAALYKRSGSESALVLTLPAVCADGESMNKLAEEICSAYGRQAELPDVLQYADYAQWQNDLLHEERDEASAATQFWNNMDVASPPPMALPFEAKGEGQRTFAPESVPVELNASLGSRPSAFFLACWQTLLWRLSGQQDVLIGTVSDGRTQEELAGAIGLFSKTLPIRTQVEDRPFAELEAQAEKTWATAREWQDLFHWREGQADLPFSFRFEGSMDRRSSGGVAFSTLARHSQTSRFRMQLACTAGDSGCRVELQYDPSLFSQETVARFADSFKLLAEDAAAHPNRLAGKLVLMSEAERQQVVVEFNRTAADYPEGTCFQQMFEEQAARCSGRPAVRFGEQVLTYAQLNESANQLAHHLRSLGVKADTAVGLCLDRSAEMIVGLMAILKAGGAYLPLIPDNPRARLLHQLTETKAPVLLTQEKFLGQLPEFNGQTVCVDRDALHWAHQPKTNPAINTTAGNLAYVIYTSGSTGTPKGVAVQHSNLVNYTHFMCRRLNLAEEKDGLNFATVSTLAADLGNTAIFPSLASGGCLHVIGYDMALDGNQFAAHNAKHPIDVLKITPSHLGALLNASTKVLPRKWLITGGEALTWELKKKVEDAGSCALLNHYGPTEATIGCCTFHTRENDVSRWTPATIPVGRPIANTQIYILDRHLAPVPVGVAGELCIGGKGIAAGYMNQPQQTAERFVPDPFAGNSAARMYRTGDLARFLPDGSVEFLGRIDQQVKIRGFRVEPAEIEAALKRHAGVHQVAVVPFEENGDKKLVAYVVPAGDNRIASDALRALAQQHLPEYMVPSWFVMLDSLPLTANGKLDRRALPAPGAEQSERAVEAPRNAVEEGVVAIWREVLNLPRIGLHDNFFDLGGHSLLATQVISRVCTRFQVQVPLRVLFETPTVAGLARVIEQAGPENAGDVAELLSELENLTDEEAERLLAAETEKGKEPASN